MGFLDDVGSAIKGAIDKIETAAIPAMISEALAKTDFGDLQGLIDKLRLGGLKEQVNSWLSNGRNLPVTAQQIHDALGNEQVKQLADKFGVPLDAVSKFLADHLPTVVDQASPEGKIESNA